jgi:hypothetical protein
MQRLWLVLVVVVACGAPAKPEPLAPAPERKPHCDSVRDKIAQLYRAEAQVKEPKRVDDAVADNTHMVLADCEKDPVRAVPCLESSATVAEIEKRCLVPLDLEGTEGEGLAR